MSFKFVDERNLVEVPKQVKLEDLPVGCLFYASGPFHMWIKTSSNRCTYLHDMDSVVKRPDQMNELVTPCPDLEVVVTLKRKGS